jgi:hypothetical protein
VGFVALYRVPMEEGIWRWEGVSTPTTQDRAVWSFVGRVPGVTSGLRTGDGFRARISQRAPPAGSAGPDDVERSSRRLSADARDPGPIGFLLNLMSLVLCCFLAGISRF